MHSHWQQQEQTIQELQSRETKKLIDLFRENELLGKIYRETGNTRFFDSTRTEQLRLALGRLYEVRDSVPMFGTYLESDRLLPAQHRAAINVTARNHESVFERDDYAEMLAEVDRVALAAPPILAPGVKNIQKSPRRPGAPALQAV